MTLPHWLPCAIALVIVACDGEHGVVTSAPRPPRPRPNTTDGCTVNPLPGSLRPVCSCSNQPSLGWCQNGAARSEPRDARAELVRAAALDVLAYRCSACHLSLNSQQTLAEPTTIDDLGALVESGHIVPLNSAASPLVQRSASGEMPPPESGLPPLPQAELDVLALLIDSPRFWPQLAAPAECDAAPAFTNLDSVFQSVVSDLATLPPTELGFYRYLSLNNRANAVCDAAELEGDRRALALGLNLLSLNPSLHAPIAIDEARQLFRIDLRALDWARGIDVGGVSFRDVWEAIAAQSPYAVAFTGEAAAQAAAATGTAFPLLSADHVLDQALAGDLYYAIVGRLPAETWWEFQLRALGVDLDMRLRDGLVRRGGTVLSRNTQGDRLAERTELARGGVLWRLSDEHQGGSSIFDDPFDDGGERDQVIFSLPNGLFAFLALDDSDALVPEANMVFDTLQGLQPAHNPTSCLACHASGLIPLVDQLRDVFLRDAAQIGLNAAELALVERIYPEPSAFLELFSADSAQFQQALNQLQLPSTGSSPVAAASLRFDAPLTLRDAAGELGVPPDALAGSLPRWLEPLQGGTLDRDAFAAVYVASLCVLSEPWANRPDASACERAIAALGGQ